MEPIILKQPKRIEFGTGCMDHFCDDYIKMGLNHLLLLTADPIVPMLQPIIERLNANGVKVLVETQILREPTVADFKRIFAEAQDFEADSVFGVGGGSVMDVAKLVATFLHSEQTIEECFGIGFVKRRGVWYACAPTTAGTGSEVSPNAILLDESDNGKKGIISDHLLADVAYLDPALTISLPSRVTAATGMDALTHCIEVYTNKFAHPAVDMYARYGIQLISRHLKRAVTDGNDIEAREAMLLGSMYGGLGLGPVNTAAVHALAYPVGGMFHKSHGLSNAVLLPTVMKFNMQANLQKYAEVALGLRTWSLRRRNGDAWRGVRRTALARLRHPADPR